MVVVAEVGGHWPWGWFEGQGVLEFDVIKFKWACYGGGRNNSLQGATAARMSSPPVA